MARAAYLHCIYAEDVRQETSGQLSIVGVFQGGLRVQVTPAQIPKLAVIADLFLPSNWKQPGRIKLEVFRDGEVLQSIEPPGNFIQSAWTKAAEDADEEGVTMQFVVGFAGFPVTTAGRLRVRALIDDEELIGNSLQISVDHSNAG